MDTDLSTLRAQRIRDLRKGRGLTQPALGELLRVSSNTIYTWERKKDPAPPDLVNVIAMCSLFNVSADYLLGLSPFVHREDTGAMPPVTPTTASGKAMDNLAQQIASEDADLILLFSKPFTSEEIAMLLPAFKGVERYREAMEKAKAVRSTIPIANDSAMGMANWENNVG